MKKRRNWLLILVGVGVLVVFVGIGAIIAVTAWVQQNVTVQDSTEGQALSEFESVRQKFADRRPLLEIRDGRPAYSAGARPSPPASPTSVEHLHVLAWDGDENKLVSLAIPFWFLRLKATPFKLSAYASGLDDNGVDLSPEDIERYGPGIILDHAHPRGERVLVWAQ